MGGKGPCLMRLPCLLGMTALLVNVELNPPYVRKFYNDFMGSTAAMGKVGTFKSYPLHVDLLLYPSLD